MWYLHHAYKVEVVLTTSFIASVYVHVCITTHSACVYTRTYKCVGGVLPPFQEGLHEFSFMLLVIYGRLILKVACHPVRSFHTSGPGLLEPPWVGVPLIECLPVV